MCMTAVATLIGGTSVGSGYASYQAFKAATDTEPYQSPAPANYYQYDAEGNVTGSQVWNADKNAYEWRPAKLSESEQADVTKRKQIKRELLSNLAETPADRVKAYADYAKRYEDTIRTSVDREYGELVQGTNESMESRGLTGSRAAVDLQSELARRKLDSDKSIATESQSAAEQLKMNDRNAWLTTLGYVDTADSADALKSLQSQSMAANMTGATNEMLTKQAENKYLASAQEAANKAKAWGALANALGNIGGSAAQAYGYQKGGGLNSVKQTGMTGG